MNHQGSGRYSGGMKTFTAIWFGQTISLTGTKMTQFALLTWAFQQTGEATTVALLGFFSFTPYIILSPIAGMWADRFDRKRLMMLADIGAGLSTVVLFLLYLMGGLEIWHLYAAEMIAAICDTFHGPAYSASITTMIPKKHYARASGMRSLGSSLAEVGAPFIANAALALFGIGAVLLFDILSFMFAASMLLFVRIPRPAVSAEGRAAGGSFWKQFTFGFRYILARRGLFGLLMIFTVINLIASLTYLGTLPAMVLSRSGGDEMALALVQGMMGAAGVVGGIAVTVWGLPRRKIHAVLAFGAISFLFGDLLFAMGRSTGIWVIAGVVAAFWVPFMMAGDRAIWQSKVAPDVQGRVFAVNNMVRTLMMPLGYILGGVLADHVFEPAMAEGGALAPTFGGLVGVGDGAGMGLMFACTALLGAALCLSGYLVRAVRNVETDLDDHDTPPLDQISVEAVPAVGD